MPHKHRCVHVIACRATDGSDSGGGSSTKYDETTIDAAPDVRQAWRRRVAHPQCRLRAPGVTTLPNIIPTSECSPIRQIVRSNCSASDPIPGSHLDLTHDPEREGKGHKMQFIYQNVVQALGPCPQIRCAFLNGCYK